MAKRREPLRFVVFERTCTPYWDQAYEVFSRHSSQHAAMAAGIKLCRMHLGTRRFKIGEIYTGTDTPKAGAIHRYHEHVFFKEWSCSTAYLC